LRSSTAPVATRATMTGGTDHIGGALRSPKAMVVNVAEVGTSRQRCVCRWELSGLARLLSAFSPVDVISPIKGDDHQTRGLALAGELMRHAAPHHGKPDRKSTRLNSSHQIISYAVFCLKKKKTTTNNIQHYNQNKNTYTQ